VVGTHPSPTACRPPAGMQLRDTACLHPASTSPRLVACGGMRRLMAALPSLSHPRPLQHLGDDMCRSLLTFARGRPLGPTGLDWLYVHLANMWGQGVDKRSFDDRRCARGLRLGRPPTTAACGRLLCVWQLLVTCGLHPRLAACTGQQA